MLSSDKQKLLLNLHRLQTSDKQGDNMKNKLLLLALFPLLLTACQGSTSESNTATEPETNTSQPDTDFGPEKSEIDVAFMSKARENALKLQDQVGSIDFKTRLNNITHNGTTYYGENKTLMESTQLVEGEEVDEDGNPVLIPTQNIAYAEIDQDKFYSINYKESDLEVSNSIVYLIDDTKTEDQYISRELATQALHNRKVFAYDIAWIFGVADDTYLGCYQNVHFGLKKDVDTYTVKVTSDYGFDAHHETFYTYASEFVFDRNDTFLSAHFITNQYNNAEYEQDPNVLPYASFEYSATLNFNKTEINFDKAPYFINKINDVNFYSDTSLTGSRVNLNELVKFEITDYEGTKGLDSYNYFIAESSDETVIQKQEKGFVAVGTGKATLTIKNYYNDVTFSKEVMVKRPDLVGYNAYASNGEKEITKKVNETDFVEVYFFPEGALPEATLTIADKSIVNVTGQRVEKRGNTTYLIFDIQCLKAGVTKVTVTPNEAPASKIDITYTVTE